jgi:DHA2 family multidrug resistance protein
METLDKLTRRFSDFGTDAQLMALKQLMGIVRQQATVMAFADIFFILTLLFGALALLSVVMKRPKIAGGGGGEH